MKPVIVQISLNPAQVPNPANETQPEKKLKIF